MGILRIMACVLRAAWKIESVKSGKKGIEWGVVAPRLLGASAVSASRLILALDLCLGLALENCKTAGTATATEDACLCGRWGRI